MVESSPSRRRGRLCWVAGCRPQHSDAQLLVESNLGIASSRLERHAPMSKRQKPRCQKHGPPTLAMILASNILIAAMRFLAAHNALASGVSGSIVTPTT